MAAPLVPTMATISWSLSMPSALNMIATGMSSPTARGNNSGQHVGDDATCARGARMAEPR